MSVIKALQRWGLATALIAGGGVAPRAIADEFPPCAPPGTGEYLLLVQGETVEARDRIQNLLPATTSVSVCRYLDDIVVRAGGFTSLENANAWAQYLTEVEGNQAFVARPAAPGEVAPSEPIAAEPVEPVPETPVETVSSEPETPPEVTGTPAPDAVVAYAPKLLGEGYAVLVDYSNDPEIAKQLQQTLNQPIGLAVYEQQPFLLATQSTDAQEAAQVLQTLSNGRFGAFIVDSSKVVLLSSAVATP
ncbi:hypothetical protein PN498_04540 [Oscillatoria sp. CS-180]|uniref:hypothetical protein n=1 Tax=Oscillatoria sp. CS-180 TaxID=3021720 RepID=UPI00232A8152|nr:hypothetical protein [Oscillatoria sp. CS-180]MDB9525245.1 hypothetical protein [Oscillatoria sp. CS-180]